MLMERETLKQILLKYYKLAATNHILRGIRRPSYENMLLMYRNDGIPFWIWNDIKSYIQDNNNTKKRSEKELSGEKVSEAV